MMTRNPACLSLRLSDIVTDSLRQTLPVPSTPITNVEDGAAPPWRCQDSECVTNFKLKGEYSLAGCYYSSTPAICRSRNDIRGGSPAVAVGRCHCREH